MFKRSFITILGIASLALPACGESSEDTGGMTSVNATTASTTASTTAETDGETDGETAPEAPRQDA